MCITCSVIEGKKTLPGGLLYKDDRIIIHHCIDVNVPGYLVISPIRHVTGYQELTDAELMAMAKGIKIMVSILHKLPDVEKVYILNLGEETSHFHFHIFPRYRWMIDKSNVALFSAEKLDGAKLFSYYRNRNKTSELETIPEINKMIAFIKSQLQCMQ
ncbi:hypothetical protein P22_3672 [Propionispora sp. 2/2-37]|uniref:HIT family protein n=1 Tax=Propionispora sp. 2/2-37 TaxID=1677858 RepID=UPI0006BB7C54|nr:HIT family protein [Propionispora sp. 2/2-37]CUH97541.1 hypothetical protein P22_3672 [Propionispora sp. 2/2-37]